MAGSFLPPLTGSGDKYGESVSTNILSSGIFFIVSLNSPAFLKVTIPDKEIKKPNSRAAFANSGPAVKQ